MFQTLFYDPADGSEVAFMDDFARVDEFLAANYRTGLEEALCDGCLTGRMSVTLAAVASIEPVLVRAVREGDGGLCNAYDGTLRVADVTYRFRCNVFIDRGGARFLSDVSVFEAVDRQARRAICP